MDEGSFRILVVEDSPVVQAALTHALEAEGWAVRCVGDGQSALREADTGEVDAVLLDLGLPGGLDGLQVLRLLRASERLRHVPVVVLTVREERQVRLDALRLGADDFHLKPWDGEELVARLQRLLVSKRRTDALLAKAAHLEALVVADALTQASNRLHLQQRLREEFRRAQRYDVALGLVLVDLDHFHAFNLAHGHPQGDLALRETARVLRRSVRETDLLARSGGAEFALLLPQTPLAGALTVAERVRLDLAALRMGPQASLQLTASVGVATFPHRAILTPEQLLRAAEAALARAKHEGRNRICLHPQLLRSEGPAASRAN